MDIISQLTEKGFLAIIARQILEKLSLSDLIAAEGKLSRRKTVCTVFIWSKTPLPEGVFPFTNPPNGSMGRHGS